MIYWRRAALHPPPFIGASAMSPVTWASDGRKIRHAWARSHFVQANGPRAAPTMIDETCNNPFGDAGCGSNPPFCIAHRHYVCPHYDRSQRDMRSAAALSGFKAFGKRRTSGD